MRQKGPLKRMILWLRSLLFNLVFYPATALLCLVWLPSLVLPRSVLDVGFRIWAHGLHFLLFICVGVTHRIEGTPPPAGTAALVAGKHQSAWETIILAKMLDRPTFVLKRELTWIPVLGWYMLKMRMIPIDRASGTTAMRTIIKAAKRAKEEGRCIVIFPEGTRVGVDETGTYQSGIAALYKQLDLPVTPLALNSGLKWRRKAFVKQPGIITARFCQPIPAGLPKKQFLADLQQQIESNSKALVAQERARTRQNPATGAQTKGK